MSVALGASTGIMGVIGLIIGYLIFNWYNFAGIANTRNIILFQILLLVLLGVATSSPKVSSLAHLGGLLNGVFFGMCLTDEYKPASSRLGSYEKKIKIMGFGFLSVLTIITGMIFYRR